MKQKRAKTGKVVTKDKVATGVAITGIFALCCSVLYLASPAETSADEVTMGTAPSVSLASSTNDSSTFDTAIRFDSSSEVDIVSSSGTMKFSNSSISNSSLVETLDTSVDFDATFSEISDIIYRDTVTDTASDDETSEDYILDVPNWDYECDSNRKLYMAYTAVTDTASAQYDLLYNNAYTTPEGLRAVGDRYCIALGSYYTTTIGQKVDLLLEDGSVVHCILGDCKADCHTNTTHQYNWGTGNVAEFIVDDSVFSWQCDGSGTVNWVDGLDGRIVGIALVD